MNVSGVTHCAVFIVRGRNCALMATKQTPNDADRELFAVDKTTGSVIVSQDELCRLSFNSCDNKSGMSLKVDKCKNVISCSPRLGNYNHNFVADNKENLKKIKEAKNRSHEVDTHCISHLKKAAGGKYSVHETKRDKVELISSEYRTNQVSPQHIKQTTSSQSRTGQVSPQHITKTASSQSRTGQVSTQHITKTASIHSRTGQVSPQHIIKTTSNQVSPQHITKTTSSQSRTSQVSPQQITRTASNQSRTGQVSPKHITNITSSQSRSGQISPQHITKTTSSQSRTSQVLPQQITRTASNQSRTGQVSPKHITHTVSSPGKFRNPLGSRSFSSICPSPPPSTVCQSLKSSLVSTLQAASDTFQCRKKNKMVNIKNKNLLSSTIQKQGKDKIQDEFLKVCLENCDHQTIPLSEKSATTNILQDKQNSHRKITTVLPKSEQDGTQSADSPSAQRKRAGSDPVYFTQSSIDNTKSSLLSNNCKTTQFLQDPGSLSLNTTSVSYRKNQEIEFCTDLKIINPVLEIMNPVLEIMNPVLEMTDDDSTVAIITNNDVSEFAVARDEMKQSISDLLSPISIGEYLQTVSKSSEVLNNQQIPSSFGQTCSSSSTRDSLVINSLSARLSNVDSARFAQGVVPNENKLISNLQNVTSKELSPKETVNEQSDTAVKEISNLHDHQEYMKCLHWSLLKGKTKNIYLDLNNDTAVQGLWSLVDSKEDLEDYQEEDLDRFKNMNLLDNILGRAEISIESLALLITQQEDEDCPQGSLQNHHLARDICISESSGIKEDQYNEKLDRALKESEQLLAELSMLTGENRH